MSGFAKFWTTYLAIFGALTALVFMEPAIIFGGLFLFFLPGAILYIAPSLFFYSLAVTVLVLVLHPLRKARCGLALLIVLVVGFSLPYPSNQAALKRAAELMQDDLEATGPLEVGPDVALITSFFGRRNRNAENSCDDLCLRLLYDGVAERVLIGAHEKEDESAFGSSTDIGSLPVTAWFIDKRDVCPASNEALRTADLRSAGRLSQRMAAGDCLVSAEATLAQADTLYVTEHVLPPRRYELSAPYDLDIAAVSATRKRVLERTAEGYRTLFQQTETIAEPLMYPLLLAGVGHGSGGSLRMSLALLRKEIVRNEFESFDRDVAPGLFGLASTEPGSTGDMTLPAARALLREALASAGPKRQAGHDFFPHYLKSFWPRDRDLTPTQEDIDVVLLALADERISSFGYLKDFNAKLETVPDDLIEAMADRILRTPGQGTVVGTLSAAIGGLPEGRAAVISDQILQMSQRPVLRSPAWIAVTRLRDGDPQAVAHYLSALADTLERGNLGRNAVKGPLIGLCRMGESAGEAKGDLIAMLKQAKSGLPSRSVINALLRMGALDDLEREFEDSEVWPQVTEAVRQMKMREMQNRETCPG